MELVKSESEERSLVRSEKVMKGERYNEVMQSFNAASRMLHSGFLVMGKCLNDLKKEQLWRLDGNHSHSFREWVEGELRISYSQAMRLIQVYNEVGAILVKDEFVGMDIYKVVMLLPHMKGKTEAQKEEMLMNARDLKLSDVKDNILEHAGKKTHGGCNHRDHEAIIWSQCKNCLAFYR